MVELTLISPSEQAIKPLVEPPSSMNNGCLLSVCGKRSNVCKNLKRNMACQPTSLSPNTVMTKSKRHWKRLNGLANIAWPSASSPRSNHPHHKHEGSQQNIVAASAPTLFDVLMEIEQLVQTP